MQLAAQMLIATHTYLAAPWWLSIPIATLTLRVLLIPLSLRAKAASAGLLLFQEALTRASVLRRKLQEELVNASLKGKEESGSFSLPKPSHKVSMFHVTTQTYMFLKANHKIPSFFWYMANAGVQVRQFGMSGEGRTVSKLPSRIFCPTYFIMVPIAPSLSIPSRLQFYAR